MKTTTHLQRGTAPAPAAAALAPARAFAPAAEGVHPAVLRPSTGGSPLPPPLQATMEAALGHDFSNVRVHHGPEAASIGARAFTRGSHLHFAPGEYRPHTAAGRRILAHELAHVVQQRAGRVRSPGGAVPINDDARLEGEADAAGARVASGAPAAGQAAPAGGPGARGGGPIQAKFIVRGGKITEVPDDYQLQEGEHPAESLRLHPLAARHLENERRRAANVDAVQERQAGERADELAGMRGSGVVAERAFDLMQTRFRTPADRPEIGGMFSMEGPSATHNMRTMSVANDLLGRMFRNAGHARRINETRAHMGDRPLGLDEVPGTESATLGVEYHPGSAPHYNPRTNTVSLMMPDRLDQAGHELQHAHDHIRGVLDLNEPTHRLHSEELAFQQQDEVSREVSGGPPELFAGRTPVDMARSYEGKKEKGYPGTLAQSRAAVAGWRRAQPAPRRLVLRPRPKPAAAREEEEKKDK